MQNPNELEPELEIETLDTEEQAPLTTAILEDVVDLADELYDSIFKIGSDNTPPDVAAKIEQAHELLYDAAEIVGEAGNEADKRDPFGGGLEEAVRNPDQNSVETTEDELEAEGDLTVKRVIQMARLGLINRTAVPHVSRLIRDLRAGSDLSVVQRRIAFQLLHGLIDLTTGDTIFTRVRQELISR